MGGYELLYFNVTGRGEPIRLTLSAAGIDFEDKRIAFEEWPAIKASLPSRQLPQLTLPDGRKLRQSVAICRYIAKQNGLYGSTDWELYEIEKTLGVVEDIFGEVAKIHFTKPEDKEAVTNTFKEGKGAAGFEQLTEFLSESKTGFIAGTDKASLADVMVVALLDFVKGKHDEFVAKYSTVTAHVDKVEASFPKMAEYRKNRPDALF